MLKAHFLKSDKIVRDETKVTKEDICHLFLTLSKSYDIFITALRTVTDGKLTMEFVKEKLLAEELKHILH